MNKKILIATSAAGVFALLVMTFFSLTNTKLALVSTIETSSSDAPAQIVEETDENQPLEEDQGAAVIRSKKNQVSTTTSTPSTQFTPAATTAQINEMRTMAWIYPGNPACGASAEIVDGRKVHALKAEFFTISGGFLTLLDASNTRCNGYSPAYIGLLKQYSTEQYATVSSASVNDMGSFFSVALAASST